MRKLFLILCTPLLIWGTARFCHHKTGGFRLEKIQNTTTCFPYQVSSSITENIESLLSQEFHYFGRGLQSFAFLGDDGKTVLKLFNNRYQKRLFWLRFFPNKEKIAYNKRKWAMTFESYQIACDTLRQEAGLLYFHPAKTKSPLFVTIRDKLKSPHTIDLSQKGFVLQKRAELVYPHLASLSENEAGKAIDKLIALMRRKMDLGIADRDPLVRTNFGFCEGLPLQIDIGPFFYDERLKEKVRQKEELVKMTLGLKHHLEETRPELVSHLYEALENR